MTEILDVHFRDEVFRILEDFQIARIFGCYDSHTNRFNMPAPVLSDFLVHFRILFEFFHGDENNEKNAHAKNFINSWDKTAPDGIGKWKGKTDSFLSHLSYARLEIWEAWPIPDLLYPHYKRLIIKFIDELPQEHKTTDVLEKLKQMLINEQGRFI